MKGLVNAIVAGFIGGVCSPICLLSSLLSGGVAIGTYLQFAVDEKLTTKDVFYIGLVTGMSSGLSAIVFWYTLITQLEQKFSTIFGNQIIN